MVQERPRRATHVRGQGWRPGGATACQGWPPGGTTPCLHARGQGQRPGGATPCLRPEALAGRTNAMPEARGSGWEDQPQVQGAVAAQVQEGIEKLSHVEGQEGWR